MPTKQNSNDSSDSLPKQTNHQMKISIFTKSYIVKAVYLFMVIYLITGTPTKADASFLSPITNFIFGNGAQASENTIEPTDTNDYGTDDQASSSSNKYILGTDSVEPNKKNIDDCPELSIDDGALQMDTCGFGMGIESNTTGEMVSYVVAEGDTLSEIAAQFDVSVNTIKWENNITGNSIKVGQKLNILPTTGVKHIVKKGDTIDRIAAKYDADAEDIKVFNSIEDNSDLKIGGILYVPNGIIKAVVVREKPSVINKKPIAGSSVVSAIVGFFMKPTSGPITSPYGPRKRAFHYGVDIGAARGTPVVAAASGVVVETLGSCREGRSSCGGRYGNYIVIQHSNGTSSRYAHLTRVGVNVGESVSQGENIGTTGNTGHSTGPHLHFQIEKASGATIRPVFSN